MIGAISRAEDGFSALLASLTRPGAGGSTPRAASRVNAACGELFATAGPVAPHPAGASSLMAGCRKRCGFGVAARGNTASASSTAAVAPSTPHRVCLRRGITKIIPHPAPNRLLIHSDAINLCHETASESDEG